MINILPATTRECSIHCYDWHEILLLLLTKDALFNAVRISDITSVESNILSLMYSRMYPPGTFVCKTYKGGKTSFFLVATRLPWTQKTLSRTTYWPECKFDFIIFNSYTSLSQPLLMMNPGALIWGCQSFSSTIFIGNKIKIINSQWDTHFQISEFLMTKHLSRASPSLEPDGHDFMHVVDPRWKKYTYIHVTFRPSHSSPKNDCNMMGWFLGQIKFQRLSY